MGRKQTGESDEARLKRKIADRSAAQGNLEADPALRALRKRLKREQRKRRALALRKRHATGSKPTEAAAPVAG
jgi:hypothetical protein